MENTEVTNFGNNPSDPKDPTSSSELNPLQNPTLGRNLGRWAQVYFTNPPEKREQAVVELLRELEKGIAIPPNGSNRTIENGGTLCPVCQREYGPSERFCGACGAPLSAISEPGKHDHAFLGNNPVPSFTPISPEGDAQWLRDKAFATFDSDSPKRQAWKYLVAVIVVALAGLGYFGWSARSERAQTTTKPAAAVPAAPQVEAKNIESNKPSQITSTNSQSEKMSLSKPSAKNVEARPNPDRNAQGATLAVQRQKLSPDVSEPAETAPENGARELLLARHYLDGKAGTTDTAEAVKWLWKAVSKQNATAVMLLADLYIRGDGVAKNCDQARLLLGAAAKKGSTQAATKLRTLDSGGCS
jgi:TPR repeat protein